MNVIKKWSPVVLVILVVAAMSVLWSAQPVQAAKGGGGRCPLIYAPVICDNGKVYSNQCFADRAHAKNCVPLGELCTE